jgi:tubulin-specific chaperone A
MDTKSAIRQIKIKTGILKRCTKEYSYYAQEKVTNQEKLEKLKQGEAEEGLIWRAEECLAESEMMMPNCAGKIFAAIPELQQLIEENSENAELIETEEWKEGVLVLEQST